MVSSANKMCHYGNELSTEELHKSFQRAWFEPASFTKYQNLNRCLSPLHQRELIQTSSKSKKDLKDSRHAIMLNVKSCRICDLILQK